MGTTLFDEYTYLHFAVGVVAFFLEFKLITTIGLHVLFEVIENSEVGVKFINNYLLWFWPGGKDVPDYTINIIGDTIGVILGWLSAWYISHLNHP